MSPSFLLSAILPHRSRAGKAPGDLLPLARERVLDSLGEGMVILDPIGTVVYANPAAAALLGADRGAGRPGLASALEARGLAGLAAGGRGSRDLSISGEGGARRLRATAFSVRDEDGGALGAALIIDDLTETALLVERLQELASVDSLTGALNRRRFDEIGERDVELARRQGAPIGVLMLDVDLFKRVNDEWGHAAGDEVLKALSRRCGGELRTTDAFARYGGEEFAALLPDSDADGAFIVAERLRSAVSRESVAWDGRRIAITVSVGAYAGILREGENLEALLRRADEALYAAKARGRNRAELWRPGKVA